MNRTAESSNTDQRALRDALASFVTGVTVVTALAPSGHFVGLTANSFNAVSLDPPLIVWSLSINSSSLEAFRSTDYYAVNVLAFDQAWLSRHFSASNEDKFSGLEFSQGMGGVPLLTNCCAWFECRNEVQHAAGDHIILIGRVERYRHQAREPLIFHGGRYRALGEA